MNNLSYVRSAEENTIYRLRAYNLDRAVEKTKGLDKLLSNLRISSEL